MNITLFTGLRPRKYYKIGQGFKDELKLLAKHKSFRQRKKVDNI